jgi:hypothetical protein
MVEGGAVPVDRNLTWEKCRFALFNYTKKDGTVVATTTAAEIHYKDDDGQESVQNYSVGDPERFIPSKDGKTIVAVGAAQALSKSSNFYLLMNNLISAGFPENRLDADISTLDGLYTFNIGVPEPKRSGLARTAPAEGEAVREKVLSVPSKILRLPWDKKGGKSAPVAKKSEDDAEEVSDEVSEKALEIVGKVITVGGGKTTRQKVATALFKDKTLDQSTRDAIAKYIFTAEFQGVLVVNGYTIVGEDIEKAE